MSTRAGEDPDPAEQGAADRHAAADARLRRSHVVPGQGVTRPSKIHFSGLHRLKRPLRQLASTVSSSVFLLVGLNPRRISGKSSGIFKGFHGSFCFLSSFFSHAAADARLRRSHVVPRQGCPSLIVSAPRRIARRILRLGVVVLGLRTTTSQNCEVASWRARI